MVNVVYDKDIVPSGLVMNRVAEINGRFYPYRFDMNRAQVTLGNRFAGHTEEGIRYVSDPFPTLDVAKAAL